MNDQTSTAIMQPSYKSQPFPDWCGDMMDRVHALQAVVDADFDDRDRDEKDRYEDRHAAGALFRPAMRCGDRVVAWRLATVLEAEEWIATYPEWWEMECDCGHIRDKHSNVWNDEDELVGSKCDECPCGNGSTSNPQGQEAAK